MKPQKRKFTSQTSKLLLLLPLRYGKLSCSSFKNETQIQSCAGIEIYPAE